MRVSGLKLCVFDKKQMHGCIVCVSVGCEREIRYEITIVVVDNKIGKNESFCGGKSM